jgi:hypothetical protein
MLDFIYLGGYSDITFSLGCEFADILLNTIEVSYYNGAVILGTKVSIKAFLEGPFIGTGMTTGLNAAGLIPLTSPYGGPESVGAIPNTEVVDWVNVQLREADVVSNATAATQVGEQAGFILEDGMVKGLDGSGKIIFNVAINENLYVVLNHRNHIRVLSANELTFSYEDGYDIYSYDFTTALSQAYNSQQTIPAGYSTACLYTGDVDDDGNVFNSDITIWVSLYPTLATYSSADLDLDGNVFNSDINLIVVNWITLTSIP